MLVALSVKIKAIYALGITGTGPSAETDPTIDPTVDDVPAIHYTIFIGAGICGLVALLVADQAALVWFAPRLYVIEWLAGYLK